MTTRSTSCLVIASLAGRLKSTYAARTLAACGSGDTSQKRVSAPSKARSTTARSPVRFLDDLDAFPDARGETMRVA